MSDTRDHARRAKPRHAPIRVSLLGSEGAGKTCFLAGLAVLGEPNRPAPLTVLASDPGTVDYLRELAATLRRRQWPPSTTMTSLLTVRVGLDGEAIDLLVIDYPGEDFREELGKLDREKVPQLYEHYLGSDAILLLFDPDQDVRAVETHADREEQIERQLAHLQAIGEMWSQRNRKPDTARLRPIDVAVVVTKSDTVPGLTDGRSAREFFRGHAQSLDARIRQHADRVEYFALSAVGRSETVERDGQLRTIPASELLPAGYDAIFRWIVTRHWRRKTRRTRRRLLAAFFFAALLAAAVGGGPYAWRYFERLRANEVLQDPGRSVAEKIEDTSGLSDPVARQNRAKLLEEQVEELRGRLAGASSEPAVEEIIERLQQLSEAEPGVLAARIDEALQAARQKKEDLFLERVRIAFDAKNQDFAKLATQFLGEYSQSTNAAQVRAWLIEARTREQQTERTAIKQVRVTNAVSLKSKSERIFEFLDQFAADVPEVEAKRMRRAAELAKQFSEVNAYSVTLKSSGGFTGARSQGLRLYVDKQLLREYNSPSKSKIVTWDASELQLQWTAGQQVKVVLRDRGWGDEDVASMSDQSPLALRLLGRRQKLTQFESGWEKYCDNAFFHFQVKDLSEDDWKSLELYVLPGDAW